MKLQIMRGGTITQTNHQFVKCLAAFIIALSILCSVSQAKAATVGYTLTSTGLATLTYNSVNILNDGAPRVWNATFVRSDGTTYVLDGFTPVSTSLTGNTVTNTYAWGSLSCTYSQVGSNVVGNLTVNNTNTDVLQSVKIAFMACNFLAIPSGGTTDSPAITLGTTPITGDPTFRPAVAYCDWGGGIVDLCNENVNDGVIVQIGSSLSHPANTIYPFYFFCSNVPVNGSKSAAISMRFNDEGVTGATNAADLYQRYAAYYPETLQWDDHRMIGNDYICTSAQPHPGGNLRGWFHNDPTVNVADPSGYPAFRTKLLSYADSTISELQVMGAQGVIIWDIEGQQYVQPNPGYIADPTQVETLAPEMGYVDSTGIKTVDAFFKKFTDAGYKVGVSLRPTFLSYTGPPDQYFPNGTPLQTTSPDVASTLEGKLAYAMDRWGCTLFYVDSNVDTAGNTIDPTPIEATADLFPNALIMTEHQTTRYYGKLAAYQDFFPHGVTNTFPGIYDVYPGGFTCDYVPSGNVSGSASLFQAGISAAGDIMMWHGWFADNPNNSTMLSIYNGAGHGPTTARITSPTNNATIGTSIPISVTATPASGQTITKVDFYQDNTTDGKHLLGTVTSAPYNLTWSGVTPGRYVVSVKVTDSDGLSRTPGAVVINVTNALPAPVITSPITANGTTGVAFSYHITASNSPTSFDANNLPPGLAVDTATGFITGTPTTVGVTSTVIAATNTTGTSTITLTITVKLPPPVITSAGTASGITGASFSYQIVASNSPTSFNATSLPAGLSVDTTTGLISGIPTTAAISSIGLSATSVIGTGFKTLTLSVISAVTPFNIVASYTLGTTFPVKGGADANGDAYDAGLLGTTATYNGTNFTFGPANLPNVWSQTTVQLPAGTYTSLNMLCSAVNGNLQNANAPTFTVNYTDGTTQAITLSGGMHDWGSSGTFTGETRVVTMANYVTSNGLAKSPASPKYVHAFTFTLTGHPVQSITLPATRQVIVFGFQAAGVIVPVITSPLTVTGTTGVPLTYTITASNTPTSFFATPLPAGLVVITQTGVISGTPTTIGTTNTTVSATNAAGTATATVVFTINPPAPVITGDLLVSGQTSSAFSYQITATNNPTSYNATGLPAGLSVNTSTGLITGTPTSAGTTNVTISAANAGGAGSATLTIIVNPPPPVITSTLTATGIATTPFSYQIAATNDPASFNATGLPAGLSVNASTGGISGTPTAVAVTNVAISATNTGGTGSATLVITIRIAPPVITSTLIAYGTNGTAFSYQITASNSPTSYNATSLPAGLTINTSTGLISGTPTVIGEFYITISATNSTGTGSAILDLTTNPKAPVLTSFWLKLAGRNQPLSYQITATNNPTSYGAIGLPAGLSVNTSTGLISGTPTGYSLLLIKLSATNAGGTGTMGLVLIVL